MIFEICFGIKKDHKTKDVIIIKGIARTIAWIFGLKGYKAGGERPVLDSFKEKGPVKPKCRAGVGDRF